MRFVSSGIAAFIGAVILVSPPAQAHEGQHSPLSGWWGYDKECPASDDGFALERGGRATDGNGTYVGRWSERGGRVTIIWMATKSERPRLERSKWRIVEILRLVSKPNRRAMLVNIKDRQRAWLCRKGR